MSSQASMSVAKADYEVYVSGSPLDQTVRGWIAIKTSTDIINAVGQIESLLEVQMGSLVGYEYST
jgi:hypothetical protein